MNKCAKMMVINRVLIIHLALIHLNILYKENMCITFISSILTVSLGFCPVIFMIFVIIYTSNRLHKDQAIYSITSVFYIILLLFAWYNKYIFVCSALVKINILKRI